MPRDNDQSLPELFRQAPLEHQIQHLVHVLGHTRTKSRSQHSYTLKDGLLIWGVFLARYMQQAISYLPCATSRESTYPLSASDSFTLEMILSMNGFISLPRFTAR